MWTGETDFRRQHAFTCPAGCRGPEPDGTFEFIECPECGSRDTSSTRCGDAVEEVECHACGTIASLQIAPPSA
jgi:ribosomal protein S27E